MNRPKGDVELHTAGATVRHVSPFANVIVPVINEPIGNMLRDKWVIPLYMRIRPMRGSEGLESVLAPLRDEIDLSLVTTLLSYFDWRPRIVGAWLAALRGLTTLDDHIGRLLVRSDVCYAAGGYCLALARFNTARAREYLVSYLDYYLTRRDLVFDQRLAMAALAYLDRRDGRQDVARVREAWERFCQSRPADLETMAAQFGVAMRGLETLSAQLWPGS